MESEPIKDQSLQMTVPPAKGCSGLAAIILLSLWILLLSFVAQFTNWTIVQVIFEGSLSVPNIRWIIPLSYGILLFIPLVIAELIVKEPVAKHRIKALRYLAILSMLFATSKLPAITNWQLTAALQLGAVVIFLLGTALTRMHSLRNLQFQPGLRLLMLAASVGAILGIPWVLWGAQGSYMDTLLALLVCASLGLIVGFVLLTEILNPEERQADVPRPHNIWGAGWIVTLGLIILTTAIEQNGNGWILLFSALPLGFACAALAYQPDGNITIPGRAAAGMVALFGLLWPMMMIDPDELSMIISMGTGELLEYALKGTAVAFGIALVVMLLLVILRRVKQPRSGINLAIGILSWGLILGLYYFIGQPGFYGEKVFVVLKSQADLSSVETIPDVAQRRQAVYSTLVKHAGDTQKDMRSWMDARGISYTPYYLVNAVELYADPLLRAQIAARSDVDRVLDSPMLRPLAEKIPVAKGSPADPGNDHWNLQRIKADKVHKDLHVFGDGIVIGQSDSGVQGDHPELAAAYRGNLDGSNDYNWFDPWYGSSQPVDIGGHGTHTLGSIVGKNVGVAPGAHWIGCVNLARNLGNPGYYLDCMQFMLAPFPQKGDPFKDGRPEKGADILNNSWGCPDVEGCDPATFLPAVAALKTAGVFVVASAGNAGLGGCATVKDPLAIYADAYSVGAVDRSGNLAGFSSVGPVDVDGSGRIKPDIVAPGVDVYSSYPASTYETAAGTSMAGPHVVGVVALMWSANPGLIGEIDKTREILNETADEYTGVVPECVDSSQRPNNAAGFGIVNAEKAVEKALEFHRE